MKRVRHDYPERKMLHRAKARAKKRNIIFDIIADDIIIPDNCPVLGIPIKVGEKLFGNNSPSLDRIDPSKGYVRGNIVVMSYRANRIKNDSTLNELEKIVEWLRDHNRFI